VSTTRRVTPHAAVVLTASAIPPERWGLNRLSTLSDGERRFYGWILRCFRAGKSPNPDELTDTASKLALEEAPTLAKLARADLVHCDPSRGGIVVAYPFSARPTAHVVRFEDGSEAFAMCAIDALGIAPMFGEPIEISSRDPLTGEQIQVELEPDGNGSWQPQQAVVVCGTSGSGDSCDSCCAVLNFFASAENATRWLASHADVRGGVISIDDAIAAGRTVFGDILKEA
jgi:hypothetical protein